jgi:carotenoid cleavage dioxygenase-like enzyme
MAAPAYALGFTTLDREIALDSIPVRGVLPAWLSGTLVRVAPAKFEVGNRPYRHWFDGLAMLHRFGIGGGRVSYANAFVRSRSFVEAQANGRITRGEFATDPCNSLFGRIRATFFPRRTDNTNVNVARWADGYVALTESPLPIRFDRETLATLGPFQLDPSLNGPISTAHPHFDFARRRLFSYQIQLGRVNRYLFFTADADAPRGRLLGSVETDRPSYLHSFGMTERYLVLVESPLVVAPLKLRFNDLTGIPFIRNYRWRPERGTRIWILDKNDGRVVARADAEACFVFHHVNAFERDGEVVVDMVVHDDASVIDRLYLDRVRTGPAEVAGRLRRFRVPLAGGQATVERLAEEPIELPRFHYQERQGRPYRYVYGGGCRTPGNFFDQLVKCDLDGGATRAWFEEGCYPGEPVFVAAPDGTAEDAGAILSVVLDSRSGRSFLVVLDAQTFTERARAEVPHHIPFGFHGNFFASGEPG